MRFRKNIFPMLGFLITYVACLSSPSMAHASGQVVVSIHQGLADQNSFYHVLGEAENVGDAPVSFVNITAIGYDQTGMVVATSFTYAELDILLPGDKSPFDVLLAYTPDLPLQVCNCNLSLTYSAANPVPRLLKILLNSSYTEQLTGYLYVVGNITNIGTRTATHARVIAIFFDSQGNVTWVDSAHCDPHDILPNKNASFTVSLLHYTLVPLVATYALTAESNQYANIPEYPYPRFSD